MHAFTHATQTDSPSSLYHLINPLTDQGLGSAGANTALTLSYFVVIVDSTTNTSLINYTISSDNTVVGMC